MFETFRFLGSMPRIELANFISHHLWLLVLSLLFFVAFRRTHNRTLRAAGFGFLVMFVCSLFKTILPYATYESVSSEGVATPMRQVTTIWTTIRSAATFGSMLGELLSALSIAYFLSTLFPPSGGIKGGVTQTVTSVSPEGTTES